MNNIFPIALRCDRERGWSSSDFSNLFHESRPKGQSWYGYDVIITSPTTVTFDVFDMETNRYGASYVGKKLISWWSDCDRTLTMPHIEQKILQLAQKKRAAELQLKEEMIIETYAQQIKREAGL